MSPSFYAIPFLALVLLQTGDALRCWTCSSDLDPRCADPFNTTMSGDRHGYPMTDCNAHSSSGSYAYINSARSLCKKSKQIIRGEMSIIRSCVWQMNNMPVGQCQEGSSSNQVEVVFCETCDTDGCNSAPMTGAMSIFSIIAAPLTLLKLFH